MNTTRTALEAVEAIVHDLRDRRGLRGEWDGIDDDVKDEIRKAWAQLIITAYQRGKVDPRHDQEARQSLDDMRFNHVDERLSEIQKVMDSILIKLRLDVH